MRWGPASHALAREHSDSNRTITSAHVRNSRWLRLQFILCGMRLYRGDRAALPQFRRAGRAFQPYLRGFVACWLLVSATFRYDAVRAQDVDPPEPPAVFDDDDDGPPAPETTDLDIATPPAARREPARNGPASRPTPSTPKPKPNTAPPKAKLPDAAPAEPRTGEAEGKLPPSESAAPDDATPPPLPAAEGDFAGHGAINAPGTAPQEDFESDVQETRRLQRREFSVRFDPLNWLLLGRLGIELEMSLFKYLSVQLTPLFVTARSPIAVNYAGLDDPLTQHSHGIGPLSGVSLGVGAWFWGQPFRGYVLRLEFTNYSYSYRTADSAGPIDRVDFTERRLILFIGSHSRFGPFTFAGGFGLGYELHQVDRCGLSFATSTGSAVQSRSDDCHGKQEIALDRGLREHTDLNGPLHPVYFQARFTLGVVF
jgi:hypothetical protein